MSAISAASTRTPVSLRIPAVLSSAIEAYAAQNHLRKTDAYIHFLQRGVEQEANGGSAHQWSAIQDQLDAVLEMLAERLGAADDARSVRQAVASAAAEYPAISKAYIFGSFARGEERPQSDIDIRLVVDRRAGFNLHDLAHFMKRIEQQTGRECDVITADSIKNESLARAIEKEKELVYERQA